MTIQGIIVLLVIAFIIVSLYVNYIGPGLTFIIGIAILGLTKILTPGEILSGLANEQIAVIVMLLILGDIIKRSSVIDNIFYKAFEKAKTYRQFMMRMTLMVSGFSAFLNNTPLVALMMPFVNDWSKKHGVSASKLLIPLSYAAILGGCSTLIGTSTNLVVNSLVVDQQIIPGLEPLNIFDFSFVGVPMIILGIAYLIAFGNKLLPDHIDITETISKNTREFIAEVRVTGKSTIDGKTIEEAQLRNLKGLFLVEILRGDEIIKPVTPQTKLSSDDILMFAGNTETISDFVTSKQGLQLSQVGMFAKLRHTELLEVVVPHNSTLISKTAKTSSFRGRFDAAIIAIHRNGERVSGKIGDVRLQAGDVLLLITGEDFAKKAAETNDIYPISKIKEFKKLPAYKSAMLIGGTLAAVILSGLGFVSLFIALLALLIILTVMGISSAKDIAKGIDFNLVLIIALSLALGTAMVKTGVANVISHYTFEMLVPFGVVAVMAGMFLLTNLMGSVITNIATVALTFPIVLTFAINSNLNPKPFILLVAFAGAANFITPIGYQTNLMVYGPGRYKFTDFLRIGFPLAIMYMIVAVAGLIWQFDLRLN